MTNRPFPFDSDLFERYLEGRCTPAERVAIDAMIAEDQRVAMMLERVRSLSTGPYPMHTPIDGAAAWETFARRVVESRRPSREGQMPAVDAGAVPVHRISLLHPLRQRQSSFFARIPQRAALFIAACAAMIGVTSTFIRSRFEMVHEPAARTYVSGSGQTTRVSLADGSHVIVAAGSRLTIPGDFNGRARMVTLVGEAYFSVPKSTGIPFVVRTGQIMTRVLGTTFNVRRYPSDPWARITVLTGRVAASAAHASATVGAGDIVQITDSVATEVAGNANASSEWASGRLVFENMPVSAVLTSIGHWYGYEFKITDSALANRRIAATFYVNESQETLAAIKHLLNVTMTFEGSTVIVRPKQRHGVAPARYDDSARIFSTPTEVGK